MSSPNPLIQIQDRAEAQDAIDRALAQAMVRVNDAMEDGTLDGRSPRKDFDDETKLTFLLCLSRCGMINTSAAAAGISVSTVRSHRMHDDTFDEAVDVAMGYFRDKLESEAIRRAVEGVEEPQYYKGQVVGTKQVYSDRLLEKLMNRHIPEYKDAAAANLNLNAGVLVVAQPSASVDDWQKQFNKPKVIESTPQDAPKALTDGDSPSDS